MSDFCVYEYYPRDGSIRLSTIHPILNTQDSMTFTIVPGLQDKDENWWRAYLLEDNVWDEFNESDDHIVPHSTEESGDQFTVHVDHHKKPRCEIVGFAYNVGNAKKKEEASLFALTKKDRMLDKGSWSHAPDGVFPVSCDSGSVKEVASTASEEIRSSNHCSNNGNTDSIGGEFTANDPILSEKSVADDNDTYHFPLSHLTQTDNDLNFFDNDREDKESSDLLYYDWPDDIGNFEDVDRMFRHCDSTFGLGSLSNDDDLCWFSSSHPTEGSEDVLKLGSKLSSSETNALNCISEHQEAFRLNNAGPTFNDSNKISPSNTDSADHTAFSDIQFSNGPDARSINKDNLMLKEQISSQKNQERHRNQSEGKRKERNMDNIGPFHRNGNFKKVGDTKCSLRDSSHQVFSPSGLQQCKPDIGSDSLNYMQTNIPYMHMDYGPSSDQTSACPSQSRMKSESNGLPSSSPKESSFASNQVQSMESSHGPSLEHPAMINGKRERQYHHRDLQAQYARNFKCANTASPTTFYEAVQNQTHQSEFEIESHSEIEGASSAIPAELDSNAQESSCMSSALDEISLEATSFRQLQQVMEQLDIRTKLCIRDSLYRLARSAEQRHNCVDANGGKEDDRDASGSLMADDTNKGTGFLDIETDTNPIDRSIAHLLFHRPSDPSVIPVNDALSLKSHTKVRGSITSPPVISTEQVRQEESASGVDKTL